VSALPTAAGLLTAGLVVVLGAVCARPASRVPPPASPTATSRPPSAWTARRRTVVVLMIALLGGAATAAVGPLAVGVAGGAVALLHRHRRRVAMTASRRAADAELPDAVELLVLCIHAGCSPTQAIVVVAARAPPAVRAVFADIELHLHRGQSLAVALEALAPTGPLGRDVARAIAAADRDGTALVPVLDRLAADARAARRRLAEADARRLPVRLTFPLVTCTLPAFVLVAIAPAVLGAISTLRATGP